MGVPLYGDVFGEALGEESEDEEVRRRGQGGEGHDRWRGEACIGGNVVESSWQQQPSCCNSYCLTLTDGT